MHRTSIFGMIVTGLLSALAGEALGQHAGITYQGRLRSAGAPASGGFDFVFRLCSQPAPQPGIVDVLETFPPDGAVIVEVVDGLFTQELAFDPAHFTGEDRWLEIEVAGVRLLPRQRLTHAPYATTAAQLRLPYHGTTDPVLPGCAFSIMTSGPSPAICGDNTAATGATCGVSGTAASIDGTGVCGQGATGVKGTSTTAGGSGVVGHSSGDSGTGVLGRATSPTGLTYGAFFTNASNAGTAVRGDATATAGETYGGRFFSAGSLGVAVKGSVSSTTGLTFGGKFDNESTSGVGVQAKANALTGFTYGGWFESRSATKGIGVLGVGSSPTGVNYGVIGRTLSGDANAYGVYSIGRLGATGPKSFRIDHPLAPTEKYLLHYAAEGPAPQNVYNGTIETDAAGYAWVQLPAYFESINKDFRYQLTVVDGSDDFVAAKVTQEIADGRFRIRTSKPNVKVCWEVKGTRNDLYVQAYGAPTEVDKPEGEHGTYQHPELYGLPPGDGGTPAGSPPPGR